MAKLRNVVVAGASGNLGPVIVSTLLSRNFNVRVLSRRADFKAAEGAEVVVVDYTSLASLTAALEGQDAVVSTLEARAHDAQDKLIEAAIATGVQRFLPSEFGHDTTNAEVRKYDRFQSKMTTQRRLQEASQTSQLSYSLVITSFFFDWGLPFGVFGLVKDGPSTMYGDGKSLFTATNINDIGTAVASILEKPEETKNRKILIGSLTISQERLFEIAGKAGVSPGEVMKEPVDSLLTLSKNAFAKNPPDALVGVLSILKHVLYRGKETNSNYTPVDNELLGVKLLSDDEVGDVIKNALG